MTADVLLARDLELRSRAAKETLLIGLNSLDALTSGFPRGAISEITGPESSGRATLVQSLLAAATAHQEICVYVDTSDSFGPVSADSSGILLSQLVWIRCNGNTEHAFQATDELLHAGGFGVIVLDLCRVADRHIRRIPLSYWYRFRRAVENTSTILAVLGREPLAKSCASLVLELKQARIAWPGSPAVRLLGEVETSITARKPVRSAMAKLQAKAVG